MNRPLFTCALLIIFSAAWCSAQDVRVPESAVAGSEASISAAGNGRATFYLVGPGVSIKSEINLGEQIRLRSENLKFAGEYLAIVCSDTCLSSAFTVKPAPPASLTLLVHPSRVPVGLPDAVSGVAFPFDQFGNLVIAPLTVDFHAAAAKGDLFSRAIPTRDGVTWFRTASGRSSGPVNITASVDTVSARRVLQQVGSDPCNLRIKGERTSKGIIVETEPVRDCMGNPVSDGTIVTFTANGSDERSTIDAPLKGGVAKARIIDPGPVTVSAASGVAMGNELRVAGAKP